MSGVKFEFSSGLDTAIGDTRAALIALYEQIAADPSSPQDVARQLGVNKTLTWAISRVIQSTDPLEAVGQMPGSSALEGLLNAASKRGAPEDAIGRVRNAVGELERVIEIHVDDRATLDLVLDGMGRGNSNSLELSRKLAFRGNSGIYGLQARTRLMCCVAAPNPKKPDLLDLVMIAGFMGFRRLRSDVQWPLFKTRSWSSGNDAIDKKTWHSLSLSPSDDAENAIVTDFGRGPRPQLKAVPTEGGLDFMLLPGPIGNAGAFDCVRAEVMREAASRYATSSDSIGEFGASVTAPSEQLVFDLIVHKDLAFALHPRVLVFPRVFRHHEPTASDEEPSQLPLRLSVAELPGSPPAIGLPAVPGYSDLIDRVCARMSWDPTSLRGVRLHMKYPPLNSTVLMRFDLPERPPAQA
jgi:hypothetical protein